MSNKFFLIVITFVVFIVSFNVSSADNIFAYFEYAIFVQPMLFISNILIISAMYFVQKKMIKN